MKGSSDKTGEDWGPASPPSRTHSETLKQHWLTDPGAQPKLGPPWASPALLARKQRRLGILLLRNKTNKYKRNLKAITVPKNIESFFSTENKY